LEEGHNRETEEDVQIRAFDLDEIIAKYALNVATQVTENAFKGTYASLCRCPECPDVQQSASPSPDVHPLPPLCSEAYPSPPCPASPPNTSSALVTAAAIVGSVATVAVQSLRERLHRFCQRRRESSARSSSSLVISKVEEKLVEPKRSKTVAVTQTNVTYKRDESKLKNIGSGADTHCEFQVVHKKS
jgi:hypothetical protein